MALGDRLGGHLVLGHVDGHRTGRGVQAQGGGRWLEVEAPPSVVPFLLSKGSIAVNGVSLTINGVKDPRFQIVLIPETLTRTTLGSLAVGDRVNLEADIIGKYVGRLLGAEDRLGIEPGAAREGGFRMSSRKPGPEQLKPEGLGRGQGGARHRGLSPGPDGDPRRRRGARERGRPLHRRRAHHPGGHQLHGHSTGAA